MSRRRFSRRGNSFRTFAIIGLILIALLTLGLRGGMRVPLLGGYVVAVNLVTFLAYFYDKTAAVRTYGRVPEGLLHLLAAGGGSPAALVGQAAFHHKTIKPSFRTIFWAIFIVQLVLVIGWLCYSKPWT